MLGTKANTQKNEWEKILKHRRATKQRRMWQMKLAKGFVFSPNILLEGEKRNPVSVDTTLLFIYETLAVAHPWDQSLRVYQNILGYISIFRRGRAIGRWDV